MENVCKEFNCPEMLPALNAGFKAFCEAYTSPVASHYSRLSNYKFSKTLKPTETMFKQQYDDVVKQCDSLIRYKLGELSHYIHSFESSDSRFSHVWKYEGSHDKVELHYEMPFYIMDYIDYCIQQRLAGGKNYKKAIDEYLKEDLTKPIGMFCLIVNNNYFYWENTNDITSANGNSYWENTNGNQSPVENKRSPLSMLLSCINLLHNKGAREEGDENTKEFWMNGTEDGLYSPAK